MSVAAGIARELMERLGYRWVMVITCSDPDGDVDFKSAGIPPDRTVEALYNIGDEVCRKCLPQPDIKP